MPKKAYLPPLLEWWRKKFGDEWVRMDAALSAIRGPEERRAVIAASGRMPKESARSIGRAFGYAAKREDVVAGYRIEKMPETHPCMWRVIPALPGESPKPPGPCDVDDRFLTTITEAMRQRLITGATADAIMEIWIGT